MPNPNYRRDEGASNVVAEPEAKPYKILAPGQLVLVDKHYLPDYSSDYKDPRHGRAQKIKEKTYKKDGLGNPDDDDPMSFADDIKVRRIKNNHMPTVEELQEILEKKAPIPEIVVDKETEEALLWNTKVVLNLGVKHEARKLKEQDCLCAEKAIEFYNNKYGTQFEIVETFGSYSGLSIGVWYHCNFRAVNRTSTTPFSPKLFFAEIHVFDDYVVKDCIIIDGPGLSIPIHIGCLICGNQILHPAGRVHGYLVEHEK